MQSTEDHNLSELRLWIGVRQSPVWRPDGRVECDWKYCGVRTKPLTRRTLRVGTLKDVLLARSKVFPYQLNGCSIRDVMIGRPAFAILGLVQVEELLSTEPVRLLSP